MPSHFYACDSDYNLSDPEQPQAAETVLELDNADRMALHPAKLLRGI
jgi:hypothetical protein